MCKVTCHLPEAPGTLGDRPRALIVDDMDVNRVILRAMVARLGFDSCEAADGLQALDQMRKWATQSQVSLVLLDLQMPELNGFETARCLRAEHGPSLPIVACTAADLHSQAEPAHRPGGASVQQHALACGIDLCLKKPLRIAELTAALQQLQVSMPQLQPPVAPAALGPCGSQ